MISVDFFKRLSQKKLASPKLPALTRRGRQRGEQKHKVRIGIIFGIFLFSFFFLFLKFSLLLEALFVLFAFFLVFIYKKPLLGIAVLIALLPFHAFLVSSARHFLNPSPLASFLISAWKEIVIVVLFLKVFLNYLKDKKFPFTIYWIDKFIFVFFILAFVSIFIGKVSLAQAIWGAKYDLEFLALYLIIRSFLITQTQIKTLLKIFIAVLLISVTFGFFQIFILPADFLVSFGYSPIPAVTAKLDPGDKIPAIWNDFGLNRAFSFFSGPNNFGFYLVVALIILVSLALYQKNQKLKNLLMIASILVAFILAQTFSRSAWLGGALALLILIILAFRKKEFKVAFLTIMLGLVVIASIFSRVNLFERKWFEKIVLHGRITEAGEMTGSTSAHLKSYKSAYRLILEYPLGIGMGRVNAAAVKFKNGYSVENWYLQIALEVGILGFLAFLGIIFFYLQNIFSNLREKIYSSSNFYQGLVLGVFLSLLALSVTGLFIPVWFDSSMTLTFWILAGITMGLKENINFQKLEDKVKIS